MNQSAPKDHKLSKITQEHQKTTPDHYRDTVATIDDSGKRIWLFPRMPKGKFYQARTWVSYLWVFLYFGLPFMTLGGKPVFLLDVEMRKFAILGSVFWPQDFNVFAVFFITLTLGLILFTVVYGRIFCGWICPQTIFLEMLFRKVEFWFDGKTTAKQKALSQRPWDFDKAWRRIGKYLVFFGLSMIIGHAFFLFFIPYDRMFNMIYAGPAASPTAFFLIQLFSLSLFGIYARFREQVCTLVCPYGRLQGVLLDDRSIVISYDYNRGEPRGPGSRREESSKGDCIDCFLCVDVCPTGIDIRNGTQLECINCTACIDACDAVMDKIGRPRGLVRYTSDRVLKEGKQKFWTPRVIGYTAVLLVLLSVLIYLVVGRTEVETSILRTPGILYKGSEDGSMRNLYNYKVINKTYKEFKVHFRLAKPQGQIMMVGDVKTVRPGELSEGVFFVILPAETVTTTKTPVEVEVIRDQEVLERVKTVFIGPLN